MASSTQANFDAIKDADAHAQGLDGGLNLKTDSSRLAPPATTRADNASYLNPGNVAQLPAPATVMQASTNHVYNLHARDLQQPATQGDVMVHGEVLDAPGSSTNRFTTPCWSDGNGATINTQQPCLPATLRSRVMTGRQSIAGTATTNLSNMMMARQEAGYSAAAPQRYALAYFSGTVLNATFGLVDGQVETPETLSLSLTADYVEIAGIQNSSNWVVMALNGATLSIYTYNFKGVLQSGPTSVATNALTTTFLSTGSYAPATLLQHGGRTFVAYITNPSGQSDVFTLYDVLTTSTYQHGLSSASAPNYGFACASPYSHTAPSGVLFLSVLYNNSVYIIAQSSITSIGSVVATSSTLGLAAKTGYDSSQSPVGTVNFHATMNCCAFDGVGTGTAASLGVTVFRHYPEQVTQSGVTSQGQNFWYQAVSVDRISFQANATTATSAGTITSIGQSIFRTPSGAQLCSKAFNLQPGETLGAGLSAAKNAYALVRCGGMEPYCGFSGNQTKASALTDIRWRSYAQPTYFIIDHQARIVARAFESRGPVDDSYNLSNNTYYSSGTLGTAWGTGVQMRSLATPLIVAPSSDMSALDITLPCWVQTMATTNVLQTTGLYNGIPNNLIMQPGAITLSLSAQGVSCSPLQGGSYTVLSGALTCVHDGRGVVEANYHFRAHNPQPVMTTTTTAPGAGAMGAYYYVVVWEWYDSLGRVHRSEPSSSFVASSSGASGTYFNGATVVVPLPVTAKSAVGGVMYARLYRSVLSNTSGVFYLVSTTAINALNSNTYNVTLTDDGTYQDATGVNTSFLLLTNQPRLYTNTINGAQTFAAQAPPPFIFQCAAKGRAFGIALNAQTPRLYYSSQIQDGFPFEWNASNYAPIPTDLGDVRSLEAIDDKIVLFGTRSLGAMNGDGPLGYATASGNAVSVPTPNDGFSLIGPIPTPVGCLGSGAPARTPNGIVFQGYSGIQMLGRDLSVQPIGAQVDAITGRQVGNPGVVFGRGVTLASMQAVVFTSASSPALVYNYLTQKWSTWPLLTGAISLIQRLDGVVQAALQPVTNSTYAALANASTPGCDVVQLGSTYTPLCRTRDASAGLVLESPWILPSGESGGESQLWDCTVTGSYVGPHILQVEQAADYSNTYVITDKFNISSAPLNYQYRVRPLQGSRRIATRYRISLLPISALSSNYLMATLGDLVLNYGSKQGTSRLGATASG